MTLTIARNLHSLAAGTQLAKTNKELSSTFQKLSTGLRINKASDDPAGLVLAESLRADAAVAAAATRNANDGISITSIADAAMDEISSILTRMAELATQSSNGTFSTTQRSALATEFEALGSEIQRIAETTEFNDQTLLSNSGDINIQVGFDSSANAVIKIDGVLGTLESIGLSGSGSEKLTYSINDTTSAYAQSASQTALTAVNSAIDTLNVSRGLVSAAESRLNYAISNLQVTRENFIAAESRIRDADVAQEVANLVRLQVVQQSAAAILAQANQQPSVALSLLQ